MKATLFLLLAAISFSCADLKPKEVDLYFDLKSQLLEQAESLEEDKIELTKFAVVNGDSAASSFVPDSLGWADEFQIILDADINKPALRGQFTITKRDDDNSNLKIQEFKANSKDITVQYLRIYYLDEVEKIKKIEITQNESNSIFQSSKEIALHFDEIKGKNRLTDYNIKGYQKMLLQDRVDFDINCTLKH